MRRGSMEVRYGGRRHTGSSFYRSSSGTIISSGWVWGSGYGSGYGYVFSSSRLSSTSMDTAMHLLNLELDEDMRSGSVRGTERKDTESVVHGEPINKNRSEMEEKEERIKKN